jgi:hypothetical protein
MSKIAQIAKAIVNASPTLFTFRTELHEGHFRDCGNEVPKARMRALHFGHCIEPLRGMRKTLACQAGFRAGVPGTCPGTCSQAMVVVRRLAICGATKHVCVFRFN